MTRTFFFILFLFLSLLDLSGCRASKELKARNERTSTEETSVELRRADSLWSSLAEKFNFKIEFYPIEYGPGKPATDSTCPAAPSTTMPANSQFPPQGVCAGVGGMGAALRQAQGPVNPPDPLCKGGIKSIEFSIEKTEDRSVITATDSVLEQKSATTETRQEEKASEARHDNGTVLIVAVAAAVVLLLALLIIIKKTLHK